MHTFARIVLFAALMSAGCGTSGSSATDADTRPDAGDASDDSSPPATAVGTVSGTSLDPISALAGISPQYVFVYTRVVTQHHQVVLASFADYCGNLDVMGRMLYLDLFEDPSQPDSSVTQPGRFEIWLPQLSGGETIPTDSRAVATFAVNGPEGGTGAVAQSGSVLLTAVSESRLAGTFDLTFEDGHLTGAFEAPLCAEWTRNASIPGPTTPH